ncbi:hypothetical protein E2I00_002200, partial [Balaenoptera physalus]
GLYPESVSYVLGARGHTFTLHLRKNRDLVGSGYVETYTAADGAQVTEQLPRQDHCFYQGNVEGHQGSAASLSTCAGLRGFFQAGSTVHLIEPLDGGGEEGQHALYQAQHLQQKAGTCGVNDSSLEAVLGPRVSAALRPRRLGSREAVRQRVLEVVNHVDKELNFRVVLVGLEMWNGGDKIQGRRVPRCPRADTALLPSGVNFAGTTVGLAKVSAMCSQDSGAVNQDCQNRCCNASTCLLAKGAECAHGTCCHECRVSLGFWGTAAGVRVWGPPVPAVSLALLNQVKPAGEPCRPAKDQCDLREYCDGRQPVCPEDAFWENGTPCPGGYCYNGACPTLAQRCRDLWGPGARVATETCYSYSISAGCRSGIPLDFGRVNRCGTLFCEWGQKPPERSSCTLTSSSGDCQALVQDSSSAYEPVPEGTKCGKEQVCWKGFCQDLRVYRSRNCSARCSNHGVPSGSLLVGVLVPVALLVPLALTLAGVVIYRKARSPVRRRNVAAKTAMGLSNPLFHEGHRTPVKGRAPAPTRGPPEPGLSSHPSQPPKPTASTVVKPTCTPPMPPVKPRAGGAQPGPTQ